MKEKRRRGLGDLPEPHGRLRGEYPFPEYKTKLPPRQEARYPAVPSIQPDNLTPGQNIPGIGTIVQSTWNVRPINAVDFYVVGGVDDPSAPFGTKIFTLTFKVPQGRVLILTELDWDIVASFAI